MIKFVDFQTEITKGEQVIVIDMKYEKVFYAVVTKVTPKKFNIGYINQVDEIHEESILRKTMATAYTNEREIMVRKMDQSKVADEWATKLFFIDNREENDPSLVRIRKELNLGGKVNE